MFLAAAGIVASLIGTRFVNAKEGANVQAALSLGTYVAGILTIVAAYFLVSYLELEVGVFMLS